MKKIISTVGTSLFTNESNYKNNICSDYKNLKDKSSSDWERYESNIQRIKNRFNSTRIEEDSSAEIKSISKIVKKFEGDDNIELYFLCTGTLVSRLSAEIHKEYFENLGLKVTFNSENDVIKELQVEDPNCFNNGLEKLLDRIDEISKDCKKHECIALNITGGFKALIPFITLYAQINKIPIYYIFESSSELIEIPYFPVDLDYDVVTNEWIAFDLLGKETKSGKPISITDLHDDLCDEASYSALLDQGLIKEDNNNVKLTPIGRILYRGFKQAQKDDNFNEGNIIGKFIELKIFEYWYERVSKSGTVENGKKFGKSEFDADIFVNFNEKGIEKTITIECKPGGNVDFGKIKNQYIKGLIPEVTKNYPSCEFHIYLYSPSECSKCIKQTLKKEIREINQEHPNLNWFHVKIPKNYKQNTNWKLIACNIKSID